MIVTEIHVEGMRCAMCESHVSDAVRSVADGARKIKASHTTGICTFETDAPVNPNAVKRAIEKSGYRVGKVSTKHTAA